MQVSLGLSPVGYSLWVIPRWLSPIGYPQWVIPVVYPSWVIQCGLSPMDSYPPWVIPSGYLWWVIPRCLSPAGYCLWVISCGLPPVVYPLLSPEVIPHGLSLSFEVMPPGLSPVGYPPWFIACVFSPVGYAPLGYPLWVIPRGLTLLSPWFIPRGLSFSPVVISAPGRSVHCPFSAPRSPGRFWQSPRCRTALGRRPEGPLGTGQSRFTKDRVAASNQSLPSQLFSSARAEAGTGTGSGMRLWGLGSSRGMGPEITGRGGFAP